MAESETFGARLRAIRTERGERQLDLAEALGVDVTFISKIEAGTKKPPRQLVEDVIDHFDLDDDTAEQLQELAVVAHDVLKVRLKGASPRHREVFGMYARQFSELSTAQLNRIAKALGRK